MKYGNFHLCATCAVAEWCDHYDFPDPAMWCIEEASNNEEIRMKNEKGTLLIKKSENI